MKTLRDAGMLLGILLVLTSVKIAPVEGTGNVVPLTHAGIASPAEDPEPSIDHTDEILAEVPVAHGQVHKIGEIELQIEEDHDCTSSVIVIGTGDENGESLVLRLGPARVPVPAPKPARAVQAALTACNLG